MINEINYQVNQEIDENSTLTIKLLWLQKVYYLFKCIMDFVISFIALIILAPLFIAVAIAIKIDSKGPVFFVFNRVGKNGKDFKCYKFRSMSIEAKPDSASCDFVQVSHITKVGKFIRKTSIDELPQLINVLFGQMNLIGYRPVLRNEKVLNELRSNYGVYQLKPGITGYAQVNGRDLLGADPYKKAEYDSYYVSHISPWLDIKILFKTVIVVLRKDGNIDGKVEKK